MGPTAREQGEREWAAAARRRAAHRAGEAGVPATTPPRPQCPQEQEAARPGLAGWGSPGSGRRVTYFVPKWI